MDTTKTSRTGETYQINPGSSGVELEEFAAGLVLARVGKEISSDMRESRLDLRIIPCSVSIRSDRRLLEEIVRAMLTSVLDAAGSGKVVLGCRRHAQALRICVLDFNAGVKSSKLEGLLADAEVQSAARRRGGRETDLARAQRLGRLLGHRVGARLYPGKGSILFIDIDLPARSGMAQRAPKGRRHDDTEDRSLPPAIQADTPIIGRQADQSLGPKEGAAAARIAAPAQHVGAGQRQLPIVHVVDDDPGIREAIRIALDDRGWDLALHASCEEFLAGYHPSRHECLVLDAYLPGMNGTELIHRLKDAGHRLPVIMITGNGDISMAVQAMKAGARDFLEKPISRSKLIGAVDMALKATYEFAAGTGGEETTTGCLASLTPRQRQILDYILSGQPNKNIAAALSISQRTVENHRAEIMKRTGVKSLAALAHLVFAAAWNRGHEEQKPQ
ncbi:MAG: response regulator transcription factor [Rhodospirillaceae bacterium]